MKTIEDPLLGTLKLDEKFNWHVSNKVKVPFLGNQACTFTFERFADDPNPEDFHAAVKATLEATPEVLTAVEKYVIKYCDSMLEYLEDDEQESLKRKKPSDVWKHVKFGSALFVRRRAKNDKEDGVYVTLECNCDWEQEHGLQLVLRDGKRITKLGPYNGHLTNSDAYADKKLAGVVYKP